MAAYNLILPTVFLVQVYSKGTKWILIEEWAHILMFEQVMVGPFRIFSILQVVDLSICSTKTTLAAIASLVLFSGIAAPIKIITRVVCLKPLLRFKVNVVIFCVQDC